MRISIWCAVFSSKHIQTAYGTIVSFINTCEKVDCYAVWNTYKRLAIMAIRYIIIITMTIIVFFPIWCAVFSNKHMYTFSSQFLNCALRGYRVNSKQHHEIHNLYNATKEAQISLRLACCHHFLNWNRQGIELFSVVEQTCLCLTSSEIMSHKEPCHKNMCVSPCVFSS